MNDSASSLKDFLDRVSTPVLKVVETLRVHREEMSGLRPTLAGPIQEQPPSQGLLRATRVAQKPKPTPGNPAPGDFSDFVTADQVQALMQDLLTAEEQTSVKQPILNWYRELDPIKFNGKYTEYPAFRQSLNLGLSRFRFRSDIHKALYVFKLLQGSARASMTHFMANLGESTFQEMLRYLDGVYGNERGRDYEAIKRLSKLPRLREFTKDNLAKHLSIIGAGLVSIRKCCPEDASREEGLYFSEVFRTLPSNERSSFYMCEATNQKANLEALTNFLYRKLEEHQIHSVVKKTASKRNSTRPKDKYKKRKKDKLSENNFNDKSHCNSIEPTYLVRCFKCPVCRHDHPLTFCPDFKDMNVCVRKEVVHDAKACNGCLAAGHLVKECRQRRPCGINGCKKPHHNLLHGGTTDKRWRLPPAPSLRDFSKDQPTQAEPAFDVKTLLTAIERHFELENLGTLGPAASPPSSAGMPEDCDLLQKHAYNLMTIDLSHENGSTSIQARIPWRPGHKTALQGNFASIERRQTGHYSAKALARRGTRLQDVKSIVMNYVTKGYLEPVPEEEKTRGWYLPFFEVTHKCRPTRILVDTKTKFHKATLDSYILELPKTVNDLSHILTRMRRFKYILTINATEPLTQIVLAPEDRQFHRVVFQNKHYQFTRVLFENKASPTIYQKAIAALCGSVKLPNAAETLRKSFHMGDCLDSRDTEEEMVTLLKELTPLLSGGVLKECEVYCSSLRAAKLIPLDAWTASVQMGDKDLTHTYQSAVKMVYLRHTDQLVFKLKHKTLEAWKQNLGIQQWTKATILGTIASCHDPLGLISPITIQLRKLFNVLWGREIGWHAPVPPAFHDKWEKTLKELLQVSTLTFDRWVGQTASSELHVFCDASADVYATTLYLRTPKGKSFQTVLIAAKARPTPLQAKSVSQSELDACVLGVRMARHYGRALELDPSKIFYYTDSTNALCWILAPSRDIKVDIQHRMAEIRNCTSAEQWGHVSTGVNPADIPTRDIPTWKLADSELWSHGPPQLRAPDYKFQRYISRRENFDEEPSGKVQTPVYLQVEEQRQLPWLERLADRHSVGRQFNGARRVRQIVKRLCIRLGNKKDPDILLCQAAQEHCFPRDLATVRQGELVKKGPLFHLQPFLGADGLLRSGSRIIRNDAIPYDQKYPVILSAKSQYARLILGEYHLDFKHPVGSNLMFSELRKRYLILGADRASRKITRTCLDCFKARAKITHPRMAPLPKDITEPSYRCFRILGIDFAGPFHTTDKRLKQQWHVLVMTCMQTRAAHFELCPSQSGDAVIHAFSRFSALYGTPKVIYSDNATCFEAARRELGIPTCDSTRPVIQRNNEPIFWRFIVPRAPHQGGRWERMVGLMKRVLNHYSRGRAVPEDVLRTILVRAAKLLNSRPLAFYEQRDLADPITPNHFLHPIVGRGPLPEVEKKLRQEIRQTWDSYTDVILMQYRDREKWWKQEPPPVEGRLALLMETTGVGRKPDWTLCVIEGVKHDMEGQPCSVTVRTKFGSYRRSVHHIAMVPTDVPEGVHEIVEPREGTPNPADGSDPGDDVVLDPRDWAGSDALNHHQSDPLHPHPSSSILPKSNPRDDKFSPKRKNLVRSRHPNLVPRNLHDSDKPLEDPKNTGKPSQPLPRRSSRLLDLRTSTRVNQLPWRLRPARARQRMTVGGSSSSEYTSPSSGSEWTP
ncbi:MAG: hypothetical protein ACKOKE_05870 [Actinomycetota bacterium]